jgi:hypothetical protein
MLWSPPQTQAWPVEQFQQFANPELQAFIGSVGAEPGPPDLTIAEGVSSADQY